MSTESLYQEKMQELQKQLNAVMQAINTNSKVVSFLNSPVGHYLEDHPFVSLSLLVFVVMSAIPVGLFLMLLVGTAVSACIVVILLEGFVMSISGVALICVLIILAILSFAISGLLSVCYAAVSSLTNFVYLSSEILEHYCYKSRLRCAHALHRRVPFGIDQLFGQKDPQYLHVLQYSRPIVVVFSLVCR
ncbi:lipid droplet assembly factor 1 isoform X2 [Lissotriton helveticus]